MSQNLMIILAVVLAAATTAISVVVIVLYILRGKRPISLEKAKPTESANLVDEGIVARIEITTDDRVHILLEEKPGKPIVLDFNSEESAIPLTSAGDRVRIERGNEDGDEYEFTNLTLGLSVVSA